MGNLYKRESLKWGIFKSGKSLKAGNLNWGSLKRGIFKNGESLKRAIFKRRNL